MDCLRVPPEDIAAIIVKIMFTYHGDHKHDQELYSFKSLLPPELPSTSFSCSRLNLATFLIIEDDSFGEGPHIYVKKNLTLTSLRQYLEEYPIPSNNHEPLNPGGKNEYLILCTHCHYDHIGGIEKFTDAQSTILASSYSRSFLLHNLPEHSLCKYVSIHTPKYTISRWASHLSYLSHITGSSPPISIPLRIQLFQVPGHTPDSLAWYDIDEHHLYVGDTFYARQRSAIVPSLPGEPGQVPGLPGSQAAIIFPEAGNWILYMQSLSLLFEFVMRENGVLRRQNQSSGSTMAAAPRVLVSCGHLSAAEDAESMISDVLSLFMLIIAKAVPVVSSGEKRGVVYDLWQDGEDAKYSVMAPRRLAEEARKALE